MRELAFFFFLVYFILLLLLLYKMTDIRHPSAQDKIPPPPPELDMSGSKGMHRSKTVRNLNSASNKVKGLFKPKEKRKTEERPPITTSVSFGPGDQVIHEAYYQGNK